MFPDSSTDVVQHLSISSPTMPHWVARGCLKERKEKQRRMRHQQPQLLVVLKLSPEVVVRMFELQSEANEAKKRNHS